MNFKEFSEIILKSIEEKGIHAFLDTQGKLNDAENIRLCIKTKENIAPAIRLRAMYDDYTQGMPIDYIVDKVIEMIRQANIPEIDIDFLSDYSKVRKKLIVQLSGISTNKELLNCVPFKVVADQLYLTAHLIMIEAPYLGTALVTKETMASWNISEETLFCDAIQNCSEIFPAQSFPLENVLGPYELYPSNIDFQIAPIWVATNELRQQGAAVICYPDFLHEVWKRVGNFYILPSSIHEVLFVSAKEFPPEPLKTMVREVNATELKPEDILSNDVFLFDGTLSVV